MESDPLCSYDIDFVVLVIFLSVAYMMRVEREREDSTMLGFDGLRVSDFLIDLALLMVKGRETWVGS